MIAFFAILIAKYLLYVSILSAAIWFFRQPRVQQIAVAVYGAVSLPLMYVVAVIAGHLYTNPRPFVVGHFVPLIAHAADNGFPSDHTLLAAGLAMVIFPYNRRLSAALWIFALLIGAARVYVGVHHTLDIAGSILIAVVSAWFVKKYVLHKVMQLLRTV